MSQVSTNCSLCRETFKQTPVGSDQVVTICLGCRAKLNAFVQDIRTKIASYPQSNSEVQTCITDVESNMAVLATRNDLSGWQLHRAHLVVEIGQLLLDGKIDHTGFRNLVNALPSESDRGWQLDGTNLLETFTIPGSKLVFTRYSPDGGEPRYSHIRIVPVNNTLPDVLSSQRHRPESSGCLLSFLTIVTPVGFFLVWMLT